MQGMSSANADKKKMAAVKWGNFSSRLFGDGQLCQGPGALPHSCLQGSALGLVETWLFGFMTFWG